MTKIYKAHKPKPRGGSPRPPPVEVSHGDKRPVESTKAKPSGDSGSRPKEIGGPSGPEPTRYGDWERKGICVDF